MPFYTSELMNGAIANGHATPEGLKNMVAETLAKAEQPNYTPALTQEGFSFEKPAAVLQDFPSQFEQYIKRVPAPGPTMASSTRWKTLKNIGTDGPVTVSTSNGAKGANVTKENFDGEAFFGRMAVQDKVIDDAQIFARNYDDLVMLAHMLNMLVLKRRVALLHYGGNRTAALAAPAAASVAVNAGLGSLSAGLTITYKITALTVDGREFANGKVWSSGVPSAYNGHVVAPEDSEGNSLPTSVNGESDAGTASAAIGPTSLNDQHVLTWAAIPNAAAYNIYADVGGGGFLWYGTSDYNTFTVDTDPPGTGNAAPGGDTSVDANAYNGIVQVLGSGVQTSLDGAALTGTGAKKSIVEWEEQFRLAYAAARTGPTDIFVHPNVWGTIPEKIGGTSATVVNLTAEGNQTSFRGGMIVDQILNGYTKEIVNIHADPTIPPGWNVALRTSSPYDTARLTGYSIDCPVGKEYWATTFAKDDYSVKIGASTMHTLRVRSELGCFVLTNVGI